MNDECESPMLLVDGESSKVVADRAASALPGLIEAKKLKKKQLLLGA